MRLLLPTLVIVAGFACGQARATDDAIAAATPAPVSRFFFSGDGALHLHHAHFGRDLRVRFRDESGRYDAESLERLRYFFRSRSDGKVGPFSLRLVELLDFVEDRFRPSRMVLYSAYRSPELNASLAGTARASLHTQGLAADVGLEGVSIVAAWRDLRELEAGGMGYYANDGLLHVDAGTPRFWDTSTSGVSRDLSGGNARVFARTEYDRYATLDGLRVTLHGVTAVPLGIRTRVDPGAELVPDSADVRVEGDCLWIRELADEYRFTLRATSRSPHGRHLSDAPLRLELTTCSPLVGRTPKTIAANRIELVEEEQLPRP